VNILRVTDIRLYIAMPISFTAMAVALLFTMTNKWEVLIVLVIMLGFLIRAYYLVNKYMNRGVKDA